eukprot:745898-Hanusia_phi.AAC.4
MREETICVVMTEEAICVVMTANEGKQRVITACQEFVWCTPGQRRRTKTQSQKQQLSLSPSSYRNSHEPPSYGEISAHRRTSC